MMKRFSFFYLFFFIFILFPCHNTFAKSEADNTIDTSSFGKIVLTEKEKNWLAEKHVVRARVGANPPLHFFDGENKGISVDYFNLIAELIGLKVEYVNGIPWSDALENIKKQKVIDLLLTGKNTKKRQPFMRFSDDYLLMPWVIFSRTDSDFISSVNDLIGKTVAVEKDFVMQKMLMSVSPPIKLLLKNNPEETLKAVASGEADAYIGNLATSSYIIDKENLVNLKVASPTHLGDHNQAFVVRNDWPELVSLLNKAMTAIPRSELSKLRNKWFNVDIDYGISKTDVFKWLATIVGISVIFVLTFAYRNRILSVEITKRKIIEKELNEISLQQTELIKAANVGLWDWNLKTNSVHFSKEWKNQIGYTDTEVDNNTKEWESRIHPEDLLMTIEATNKSIRERNQNHHAEFRFKHKNGSYIWILAQGAVIEDDKGEARRMVGSHVDITTQKNSEAELYKLNTELEQLVLDRTAKLVIANKELLFQNKEKDKQAAELIIANEEKEKRVAELVLADQEIAFQNQEKKKRADELIITKEYQKQLEHIAHYDILTNLPNRSLLGDRISQSMLQCQRHAQSLAVVFLDLDGFKAVNDAYGHDKGDELLIELSTRMKDSLREGDSLARIGGDEFVAVLTDLARFEDCELVLERLLLATSEPIVIDDIVLTISASIGVTLYPKDNVDADLLMRHADQAMYVAKASGKNCYHLFDTAQDDAVKVQQESLEAIRNALDNHEFVLYYQPKVNMRTGLVTGTEALIRWQHPQRGLLNPIEFLPMIENHSMMIEVGEWVIDSALVQISQWQEIGLNLPLNISVNIAAVQLQQPNFSQRLKALLVSHTDVEPGYLELEVLETSALDDVNHVSTIMSDCMVLGVKFALDDFGTGYSSLTHLRRLPANLVKIDQSFVRDMMFDVDDLAIVEGVIALAKSFKREVIAEGVETIEHGTALLQMGCDLAQGYGIARPMQASDIPAWISDWKPDVSWQT
ncbi:MAG: diguanylate cyclase (GGDEF)-like protein/PAS domain S-box-containing protein [Oleiphilaceae bacterium]|jgi:diguanylate cyclase (GGDEF)-like protein/PAS domain S-box-containing protein